MAGIERALAQRIVDELTEFGVAPEMVGREVKCDSGRIDVVVYTQPRCLIELKVSLDSKTQGVAIKELMLYRRGYPGARLFIWAHAPLIRVDKNQLALLNRRGIRLWTRKIASEIALECRRTPPELACPPPRPIPRRRSDLSPEQVDAYLTQLGVPAHGTVCESDYPA